MTLKSLFNRMTRFFDMDEGVDHNHSHYVEAAHEFFRIYQLKDLLPYELYDEEHGVYIHTDMPPVNCA